MSKGLVIGSAVTAATLVTVAGGVLAVGLVGDARAFGVVVVVAGILAAWAIARQERATVKRDEPVKNLPKAA